MNTVYYLDSSAWIKRYFEEPGSGWIINLFVSQDVLAASIFGYVEVAASLSRQTAQRHTIGQASMANVRNAFEAHWRNLLKIDVDHSMFQNAADLAWKTRLKGADAVHLAAANTLRNNLAARSISLVFITSDSELNTAALSLNLSVIDPAKADG